MTALQLLQQLDYEFKLAKYKTLPAHAIPRGTFHDRTSNQLTQAILKWLEIHGHYAVRINTTGRQLPATTIIDIIGHAHVTPGKWIPGTTRKGTADIHAIINGQHVSIEVKVGKDRMSDDQHKTKQDIEQAGGIYFIAENFQAFYDFYQKLMGLSPDRTVQNP